MSNEKKTTTFLSEGFRNNSIQLLTEKNPWLLHMDFVDLNTEEGYFPNCYNGSEIWNCKGNLSVAVDDASKKCKSFVDMIWISEISDKQDFDVIDEGSFTKTFLQFFNDAARPTQQEKDYFEMVYGVKIPWSEEEPFVL